MIRAIDFQKLDMTDEEFAYYQELVKKFTDEKTNGADFFKNLFTTNANGVITIIKPSKPLPWDVVFFVQNLMINGQLREFDVRLNNLESLIGKKNE